MMNNYQTKNKKEKIHIIIGSDHGGYNLKNQIITHIINKQSNEDQYNIAIKDIGTDNPDDSVDYPDYAQKLLDIMKDKKTNEHIKDDHIYGILICKSGIGMSIAVNRNKFARGALCQNVETAIKAREHNNANILILGADNLSDHNKDINKIFEIITKFIYTKFDINDKNNSRHIRRINKIDNKYAK